MRADELLKRLQTRNPPVVLDVRSAAEYASGHIPGAIHAPAMKILIKQALLPEDKGAELVITCEHGPRAQLAQGVLSMYGYRNTTLLDGHMSGWRMAGYKTEKQG